jgi:hypothetical protein
MIDRAVFSRPARLAANLSDQTEEQSTELFWEKRILVRLEEAFARVPDARETFLFAVNQILRFCPNLAVNVPRNSSDLVDRTHELAIDIHDDDSSIQTITNDEVSSFDAIVNVGIEIVSDLPWITVNSSGWLARAGTSRATSSRLHWVNSPPNACGALAASCLGVGLAFLTIIGRKPNVLRELSLFTHTDTPPGMLDIGPPLPQSSLSLDAC